MTTPASTFPCTKCGACCKMLHLGDPQMRALIIPGTQGTCRHLQQTDNTCSIYDTRPGICNYHTIFRESGLMQIMSKQEWWEHVADGSCRISVNTRGGKMPELFGQFSPTTHRLVGKWLEKRKG